MSKSLGNGIDPLEIIDQYGADALRFTLATGKAESRKRPKRRREPSIKSIRILIDIFASAL